MKLAAKSSKPWPKPQHDLEEAIRQRAQEIYIRQGRIPGRDMDNWAQAEQEIQRESAEPATRKAIVIRVDGTQYVGEYNQQTCDGYVPGEFSPGVSVPVRLRGNKMLILRPNGKVLETTIVKTV
jgi:hypothetical protein